MLLPALVPEADIDAALEDVWRLVPRPGELGPGSPVSGSGGDPRLAAFDTSAPVPVGRLPKFGDLAPDGPGPAFRADQFRGRMTFPFPGSGALNRLVVHDRVLDFAERALGGPDLRIYQMGLWAKYTGLTDYEQPMHRDRNHSLVPFRPEPGWWHLEGFLYLTDVDGDCAPTRLVGLADSPGRDDAIQVRPDDDPELYAAEVSVPGPRGSYLAYRPDVFHRSVDLTRPGGARVLLNLSYRLAGQDWIGFETFQRDATTLAFITLVEQCTPRQLAALGVPEPGHPYWTPAMLDAMASRYPGLDLGPWRSALNRDPPV